jgi:hypothetical protein
MDCAQKPFASVAALRLLALFTACSPAAEEPAALAQPSRGAHRSAGCDGFRSVGELEAAYGVTFTDSLPPGVVPSFNKHSIGASVILYAHTGVAHLIVYVFNDCSSMKNWVDSACDLQQTPSNTEKPCGGCSSGCNCRFAGAGIYETCGSPN